MNHRPLGKSYLNYLLKAKIDAMAYSDGGIPFESLPLIRYQNNAEQQFYEQCFWDFLQATFAEKNIFTGVPHT